MKITISHQGDGEKRAVVFENASIKICAEWLYDEYNSLFSERHIFLVDNYHEYKPNGQPRGWQEAWAKDKKIPRQVLVIQGPEDSRTECFNNPRELIMRIQSAIWSPYSVKVEDSLASEKDEGLFP